MNVCDWRNFKLDYWWMIGIQNTFMVCNTEKRYLDIWTLWFSRSENVLRILVEIWNCQETRITFCKIHYFEARESVKINVFQYHHRSDIVSRLYACMFIEYFTHIAHLTVIRHLKTCLITYLFTICNIILYSIFLYCHDMIQIETITRWAVDIRAIWISCYILFMHLI